MPYVDGFLLAVPKQKIDAYKALARQAGEVWKEHGALAFVECAGDDVPYGELTSFPRAVQASDDEIVIFSWIVYESRAKRDEINAKVMADPRLKGGHEGHAVRRQAHDLRGVRDDRGDVAAVPSSGSSTHAVACGHTRARP